MAEKRPRGRPKKRVQTKQVTIRLPIDMEGALYQWAQEEGIAITTMVTRLCREALAQRQQEEERSA